MLTTFDEVDMAAVTELRKRRRDAFKAHSPELHKCTLMFIVMKVRWGEYAKHLLGRRGDEPPIGGMTFF
jgi:hypothetical protein